MKYGQTLQQRSIPEWANYNVDYNEIKHLIKVRTTKDHAQAIAIPGKDNEAEDLQTFQGELYAILQEQHQRVDLFVQSKAGEITRRLAHLDKQIAQLEKRNTLSNRTKIPVRRLEKFSKAEEETLQAGQDIQSLSRFVGANRSAFQKLLKKYRRWTGSSELGSRLQDVLGRPTSFSRRSFGPLLAQWTEVLAAVRAPFSAGVHWQAGLGERKNAIPGSRMDRAQYSVAKSDSGAGHKAAVYGTEAIPTSAARIHSACEKGSNLDVDTALAILPLGHAAGKASYWVHPDNMVEIHILLLQYTRLRHSDTSPSSTGTPSSPRSSRKGSISVRATGSAGISENGIGVVVCDDLQSFAKRRSAATICDSENGPGNTSEKAAASIRYAPKGDAIVVVGTSSDDDRDSSAAAGVQKVRFKRKALRDLFDLSSDLSSARARSGSSTPEGSTDSDQMQKIDSIRTWLENHREVRPLVQIQVKRSRFVGLGNSDSGGVWATLDRDVLMRQCSSGTLNGDEELLTLSEEGHPDASRFPHAILEVRCEGEGTSKLVSALDESHLTERVRGFSLETHAVATLCHPRGMPPPFWLRALSHDIRKIPAQVKSSNRRSSSRQLSPEGANTRQTSSSGDRPSSSGFSAQLAESSATSVPNSFESPPTGVFKKKRRSRSNTEHPLRRQLSGPSEPPHMRYWNEFDDGDEGSENEAYTIFVDPNATSAFPGAATLTKVIDRMATNVRASSKKVKSWLGSSTSTPPTPDESQPLTEDFSAEDDTDLDNDDFAARLHHHRSYSTMAHNSKARITDAVRSRDRLLSRSCIASFVASFALLLVASILTSTGRKKDAATVDLGVVVGVIASLMFAGVGLGTMIWRTERLGWIYRASLLLVFALDCVGCMVLIVMLGDR